MFWCLVIPACLTFAPCIIIPVWEDYRAIKLAESYENAALQTMQKHIAQQKRHIHALRTDPAVNVRLAKRDLRYHHPDEQIVHLRGITAPTPNLDHPEITLLEPPALLRRILGRIVELLPSQLFIDSYVRTMIMMLSGGTILAAFLLFPPGERRRPTVLE